MPKRALYRLALVCTLLLVLPACESIHYYGHVAKGQWALLHGRESIDDLILQPSTDPALRDRLETLRVIHQFAIDQLSLPNKGSYRDYTDIGRPYVVWNVFAAEAFSVEAKQWCFPVAGCVAYRGYFSESQALGFAQHLAEQGYDTYVGGVSAYSTLGWFDDPVLNTFLYRDELSLAGLIFHELAHQQLYVPGDTAFNESFAMAVELEGLRQWVAHRALDEEALVRYQTQGRRHDDFVTMILAGRERLNAVYHRSLPKAQMIEQKKAMLQQLLEVDYQAFKKRWPGEHYDHWMNDQLNNAKLLTVASYHQWLPAFKQLYKESRHLQGFYQRALDLSQLPRDQRRARLTELLNRYSPTRPCLC